MIPEILQLNNPQLISVTNNAKSQVDVWGRGTGKSFIIGWKVNLINRLLKRAITSITGQTFGQLLTRTLPSTFKLLEQLGYLKYSPDTGGHYVIGQNHHHTSLHHTSPFLITIILFRFQMVTAI